MKILRSVNRRGFNLGTAGYFTVLKPNSWFAASRLPDAFRHLSRQSNAVKSPSLERKAVDHACSRESTLSLQAMKLSAHDRNPMRLALAVLAAIAIIWALLWWMFQQ
jgi:RsiW-degrading membrane proteinase PrsW (M82 family)